jgi:hypothetical protein
MLQGVNYPFGDMWRPFTMLNVVRTMQLKGLTFNFPLNRSDFEIICYSRKYLGITVLSRQLVSKY